MKSAARQELLGVHAELSEAAPDVRLGQLVTNLSYLARGLANESVWDVEDEELLAVAREHLEQWREQQAAASQAGR